MSEGCGLPPSLYPPGYRDPDWDGTEAGYRDVVLPARVAALTEGINERYAGVLPEGWRFVWEAKGAPGAHHLTPDAGLPPGSFVLRPDEGAP